MIVRWHHRARTAINTIQHTWKSPIPTKVVSSMALRIEVNKKNAPVLYRSLSYQNKILNNEMIRDDYYNNYGKAWWTLKKLLRKGVTAAAHSQQSKHTNASISDELVISTLHKTQWKFPTEMSKWKAGAGKSHTLAKVLARSSMSDKLLILSICETQQD
jgi:hypothetical protein